MTIHQIDAFLGATREVKISQCRHGRFMYFPHDFYIGGALERYGEYIESETQRILRMINPGDVVVEVGANIGAHTIPIAKKVTDRGRVFAFEPQRIIFHMLCGNLAMNGIWNTFVDRIAISDEASVLHVPPINYAMPGNFGAAEMCSEGEPVHSMRIDDMGFKRLDLLKIDVEGMELRVLKGAIDTLEALRPVLFFENDRNELQVPLCEWLEALGYDLYWDIQPMYSAENYRQNPQNVYSSGGNEITAINMIGVPKEKKGIVAVDESKHRSLIERVLVVGDSRAAA